MSKKEILGNFSDIAPQEARDIAIGRVDMPDEFVGISVVNLADITSSMDFEEPGLHKRIRAGLGALAARSRENVKINWSSTVHTALDGYDDYDRTFQATLATEQSTWGSERGAVSHIAESYHVTNSKTIDDEHYVPPYAEQDYMLCLVTDNEGVPSAIGRLAIPEPPAIYYYEDRTKEFNPEVTRGYKTLVEIAKQYALEDLLKEKDVS